MLALSYIVLGGSGGVQRRVDVLNTSLRVGCALILAILAVVLAVCHPANLRYVSLEAKEILPVGSHAWPSGFRSPFLLSVGDVSIGSAHNTDLLSLEM